MNVKENKNTKDFWDEQFKNEYEILTGDNKPGYIRWIPDRLQAITEEVNNKGKVVDVGCGLGHLCRYLQARYPVLDVSGCDFSSYAVEKAREFGTEATVIDSCYNLTNDYKGLDGVIASDIIEHLEEPKRFIKQLKKVLKKGGYCIITTPIKGNFAPAEDHVQEFSIEEMGTMMGKQFKDVVVKNYNLFQLIKGKK